MDPKNPPGAAPTITTAYQNQHFNTDPSKPALIPLASPSSSLSKSLGQEQVQQDNTRQTESPGRPNRKSFFWRRQGKANKVTTSQSARQGRNTIERKVQEGINDSLDVGSSIQQEGASTTCKARLGGERRV